MKKLVMAAVVALAAIGLNAATINWGATKGYLYDGESANKITSGSAYLMFVTASYTNGVFDKYINSRIEGAKVNRGLREADDDDDYEDDEEDAE